MKKIVKLINNERKNLRIISQKATATCGSTNSVDICNTSGYDLATCHTWAYDECGKDYAACFNGGYDYCTGTDTTLCSGVAGHDCTNEPNT